MKEHNGYKIPEYCKPQIELKKKHRTEPLERQDYCDASFKRCSDLNCELCLFGNYYDNIEQFEQWRDKEG
jgi:hypothetical protein